MERERSMIELKCKNTKEINSRINLTSMNRSLRYTIFYYVLLTAEKYRNNLAGASAETAETTAEEETRLHRSCACNYGRMNYQRRVL
ncbi:hypothetical protein M0802_009484 [Mischocyttarus mexicanus]|nr:hypothetical protein M0802_009484 [Mischocyttarus mexicanus]